MGIMEKAVCFNVDTVWMISPVTTLMAPVPVDVCQDGRTQIRVIKVRQCLDMIHCQIFISFSVHQIESTFYLIFEFSACANGTFGVGCMLTCSGNCLNNDTCEKSNGGCKNCAPGWEGHLCNKGKNI